MNTLRTVLVSALALVSAVCMRMWGNDEPWQLWIPTALLVATAGLVFHRHAGSQVLARAVLWSNLILGAMIATMGNGREQPVALVLSLATGAGLLLLGRRGLDADTAGGAFMPVAFRATLVAILVMALADAQTLLLFGSLWIGESSAEGSGLISLGLAMLLSLSIIGLFRLRVWGLMVNGLGCVALIVASIAGATKLPDVYRLAFVISALLQLGLAAPVFLALVRGKGTASPTLRRGHVWVGSAAVLALVGLSIAGVLWT